MHTWPVEEIVVCLVHVRGEPPGLIQPRVVGEHALRPQPRLLLRHRRELHALRGEAGGEQEDGHGYGSEEEDVAKEPEEHCYSVFCR